MSTPQILRITAPASSDLEPRFMVPPKAVLDGEAIERGAVLFGSSDHKYNVGIWECTPYAEGFGEDGYPCDEFCYVISGQVSLTDKLGKEEVFSAGESYFIPKGFKGTFRVLKTVQKYYVTYDSS